MGVQLDSRKTAELAPEKTRSIDYGYAVGGSRSCRIVSATENSSYSNRAGTIPEAKLTLYSGSIALAAGPLLRKNEAVGRAVT